MISVGIGYYYLQFRMAADKEHIWATGSWKIHTSRLFLQQWVPFFKPTRQVPLVVKTWIRLVRLSSEHITPDIIFSLAKAISKPIWLDTTALDIVNGVQVQVLMELELAKFWPSHVTLVLDYGEMEIKIQY